MKETIHFTYKSIGNYIKLLTTIKYEQTHTPREIVIWHERFDNDKADDLFEQFLEQLFPQGCTINIEQIEELIAFIEHWLDNDSQTRQIRNKYLKHDNPYWVYFKIDDIVIPCKMGQHTKMVWNICLDYFKNFDTIDRNVLYKFVLNNFEIRSDNTDLKTIAEFIVKYYLVSV